MEQAATFPVPARDQAATELVSSKYQVVVSHRGPDVKRTLASLIYHRLTLVHLLQVFLDEEELHPGDTFPTVIQGAIWSASVHICIFSAGYAESPWCLDELCWILQSQQDRHSKILSVFYDVEPSDLRHIDSGPYAKAFEDHRSRGRDIEKWKKALNEASHISGLVFKTNESNLGELLEEIVKVATTEVYKRELSNETTQAFVGLDQAVEELQNAIKQIELNDTVIVGLVGVAGVGKSTLAKHFYNLKRSSSDFSSFCFLSKVRESKDELASLQQKLFRDLLANYDYKSIEDTTHGKIILKRLLKWKRVLIVFDEVDQTEKINGLVDLDFVGPGSLILITSCDRDILRGSCRKTKTALYTVKPLQEKHARELFCLRAFGQPEPKEGFDDLVEMLLKICGGLPLTLNALGEELSYMPDIKSWKLQLEKLSRKLPDSVINQLKKIYEALNREEKKMFLDIAFFLVGEDRDLAVRVLEGFGYDYASDCLESLRKKCLVDYDSVLLSQHEIKCHNCSYGKPDGPFPKERYKITMHHHIRILARYMEEEAEFMSPRSRAFRLSCSHDIKKMLDLLYEGEADRCTIRGIRADHDLTGNYINKIKAVGLRLFVVEVPKDLSSFFGSWDMGGALVWLRLRNSICIYFPENISLVTLRVLELEGHHGDVEQLLSRFIQPPSELRELSINLTDTLPGNSGFDLEHTDKNIADIVPSTPLFLFLSWIGTRMKLLDKVELKNIPFLPSLKIKFSELKNLRYLDLSGSQSDRTANAFL